MEQELQHHDLSLVAVVAGFTPDRVSLLEHVMDVASWATLSGVVRVEELGRAGHRDYQRQAEVEAEVDHLSDHSRGSALAEFTPSRQRRLGMEAL